MNTQLWASRGAVIFPIIFLILLATLHIIKPEIEPWWRLISEYELGRYGWMMRLAFLVLVAGAVCLIIALRPHIRSMGGWIGLALLGVAALGMTLGALFVTDPITTLRSEFTPTGTIHNIGGALMIFSSPFLIALISHNLLRNNPAWKAMKRLLFWLSALSIASVVAFVVLSAIQYQGAATSDMFIGWPNRALIVVYSGWISMVGWHTLKLARQTNLR